MDERGRTPAPSPHPTPLLKPQAQPSSAHKNAWESCSGRSFISCGEPTSRQRAFIYRPPWGSVELPLLDPPASSARMVDHELVLAAFPALRSKC